MVNQITEQNQEKISQEFLSHLLCLAPNEKIRGVVFLGSQASSASITNRRTHRLQRKQKIEEIQKNSEQGLKEIEAILTHFGGHKLAESTSVMGSLPIESTAAGIQALANLPQVSAILEDQKIHSLKYD